MICGKCEGNGWHYNSRNKGSWDFANPITISCKKCKGTGYVIGNPQDVVSLLKVFKNNRKAVTDKEIQDCIDAIEKY